MTEARSPELTAAYAVCRAIAKREAKNFYYAFRVLPQHKSDAMCAVYAFMRQADDLADDESLSLDARRKAMAAWTETWRASRGSKSGDPVFVALNDTQRRFGIPDELLEQLVAGTTLDLQPAPEGVRQVVLSQPGGAEAADGANAHTVQVYESFAALQHYCYLVASVVGLVCIRIFGYEGRQAEQLAIDTGIAFQLTNILRDVKEDVERGRIYISADLLRDYGVPAERIWTLSQGTPVEPPDRALLLAVEKHAQRLYGSAEELIPLLDRDARPAMRVLVRIYHGLLGRIAADPAAIFRERVSVPTSQKVAILGAGVVQSIWARLLA